MQLSPLTLTCWWISVWTLPLQACLVMIWVLWWQNYLAVVGRQVLWCIFYFPTAAFWRSGCYSSSGLHPSKSDGFNFLSPGDNASIFFCSHYCSMSLAGSTLTALCKIVLSWWKISFVPPAVKFGLHGSVRKRLDKFHVFFSSHNDLISGMSWSLSCKLKLHTRARTCLFHTLTKVFYKDRFVARKGELI